MSLCISIDTLAMAYLDDELAAEEKRELELHILDCAGCRAHVDGERAELETLRKQLAAPPAPDLLRARLARALDAEDVVAAKVARAQRRPWSTYVLPGGALAVGALALLAFVAIKPQSDRAGDPVEVEAVRLHTRAMPLEVQGVSTTPWLQEHFMPNIEVPQFATPGIRLVGARLTAVNGHDAAILSYDVSNNGGARFPLTALVIRDLGSDELSGGAEVEVGNRTLHVLESDGQTAVTYVGTNHIGYAFMSDRVSAEDLLQVVVSSDLIGRAGRGR